MAHGHKFAKLKPTNHQNFAIRQNCSPSKLPTIWYDYNHSLCNCQYNLLFMSFYSQCPHHGKKGNRCQQVTIMMRC